MWDFRICSYPLYMHNFCICIYEFCAYTKDMRCKRYVHLLYICVNVIYAHILCIFFNFIYVHIWKFHIYDRCAYTIDVHIQKICVYTRLEQLNNEELIPLVFGMQMYWFLCGLYCYCIHGIYVVIVLVISMYLISDDVWLYLCFLPVNEYPMYLWSNRLYFILWCRGAMILSYSRICKRSSCLNMLFLPVDAMFVTCLTKCMSWLGEFRWVLNDFIAYVPFF